VAARRVPAPPARAAAVPQAKMAGPLLPGPHGVALRFVIAS